MNTTTLTVEQLKFICREKELKGFSKHTTKAALLSFICNSGIDISIWEKLGKKKEVIISKPKKKEVKEIKELIEEKSSKELLFSPKKSDMVVYLQNTKDGSFKFWKITYPSKAIKESTTKFSYKVNYGKIDKTSTENVSEGTFNDIQKLIASKKKKGYVQVK